MIVLVLGGARSGKSAVAERLADELSAGEAVTYLATGSAVDDDMAARIAEHQARRPPEWHTVEAGPDLAEALAGASGTVLVDALGTWLAATPEMDRDAGALCGALTGRDGHTVVVSEEVGLGVHPSSEAGRRFRDRLGDLNQDMAAVADRVLFVIAGRVLPLDKVAEDSGVQSGVETGAFRARVRLADGLGDG